MRQQRCACVSIGVAGDAGAPLEKDELAILDEIFEQVRPYLQPEGVKAIETQGKYIMDVDGEYVTPLINGKECAYTIFDKGIAFCGIEKAHIEGKIAYKKPISCHLYPIRISNHKGFEAVNYHQWSVCSPACALGQELKVPVFRFLKDPLVRKYGESYYEQLEEIYEHLNNEDC